jgi:hypothetical protein
VTGHKSANGRPSFTGRALPDLATHPDRFVFHQVKWCRIGRWLENGKLVNNRGEVIYAARQ